MTNTETIKVEGTITLEDKQAREMLSILETRIETINERTKTHTIDYNRLRSEIKELKKAQKKK